MSDRFDFSNVVVNDADRMRALQAALELVAVSVAANPGSPAHLQEEMRDLGHYTETILDVLRPERKAKKA